MLLSNNVACVGRTEVMHLLCVVCLLMVSQTFAQYGLEFLILSDFQISLDWLPSFSTGKSWRPVILRQLRTVVMTRVPSCQDVKPLWCSLVWLMNVFWREFRWSSSAAAPKNLFYMLHWNAYSNVRIYPMSALQFVLLFSACVCMRLLSGVYARVWWAVYFAFLRRVLLASWSEGWCPTFSLRVKFKLRTPRQALLCVP